VKGGTWQPVSKVLFQVMIEHYTVKKTESVICSSKLFMEQREVPDRRASEVEYRPSAQLIHRSQE